MNLICFFGGVNLWRATWYTWDLIEFGGPAYMNPLLTLIMGLSFLTVTGTLKSTFAPPFVATHDNYDCNFITNLLELKSCERVELVDKVPIEVEVGGVIEDNSS